MLGQTPASLTLMFVFLVSPDINMLLASRHTDSQEVILSDVFLLHLAPMWTQDRSSGFENLCAREQSQANTNVVWIFQCAFFYTLHHTHKHTHTPPTQALLFSETCQTGSLSLKQSPSPFSWPGSILLSDKKLDSLMTTFCPTAQSAKITIPFLYLYWGKPFSAGERSGSAFCAGHALFSPGSGTALVCQVAGPDCL